MKILVIEDNQKLLKSLVDELQLHFEVTTTSDGLEAMYYVTTKIFDVIVLDIMLPGIDGMEILKKMREENIQTPVIMLTAKESLDDKVGAFTRGANDYVTKPFYMEELVARIYAVLRTNGTLSTKNVIEFKEMIMDLDECKVFIKEEEIMLQNKQFNLLQYFLLNRNVILLKEQIYDRIWGMESDVNLEIVEVYVSNLRKKLSKHQYDQYIKTKRGVGYMFDGK